MATLTNDYIVEQLILWLEDNVGMETNIYFDNDERVDSEIAIGALKQLLPNQPKHLFTECYTTVVASTGHLSPTDFGRLNASTRLDIFSRVAERQTGYFLKLWDNDSDV